MLERNEFDEEKQLLFDKFSHIFEQNIALRKLQDYDVMINYEQQFMEELMIDEMVEEVNMVQKMNLRARKEGSIYRRNV